MHSLMYKTYALLYAVYRWMELMECIFETMSWSFLVNEIFPLGTVLIQTSSKHTYIYLYHSFSNYGKISMLKYFIQLEDTKN